MSEVACSPCSRQGSMKRPGMRLGSKGGKRGCARKRRATPPGEQPVRSLRDRTQAGGDPAGRAIERGPEGFVGEAGEQVTRKAVGRVAGVTTSCTSIRKFPRAGSAEARLDALPGEVGLPSSGTVQAPHCARPQPKCGWVRPIWLRSA